MTRCEGRRFVEEAAFVHSYDAGCNKWDIQRIEWTFDPLTPCRSVRGADPRLPMYASVIAHAMKTRTTTMRSSASLDFHRRRAKPC